MKTALACAFALIAYASSAWAQTDDELRIQEQKGWMRYIARQTAAAVGLSNDLPEVALADPIEKLNGQPGVQVTRGDSGNLVWIIVVDVKFLSTATRDGMRTAASWFACAKQLGALEPGSVGLVAQGGPERITACAVRVAGPEVFAAYIMEKRQSDPNMYEFMYMDKPAIVQRLKALYFVP